MLVAFRAGSRVDATWSRGGLPLMAISVKRGPATVGSPYYVNKVDSDLQAVRCLLHLTCTYYYNFYLIL